jgi:hypothetical protein
VQKATTKAGAKSVGSKKALPGSSSNKQTASKAKAPTPKQVLPAQKATTKAATKAATAPVTKAAAALVMKAGAKHRRSELVPMNRVRIVQEAIQERDLEERELLEIEDLN